MRKKGMKSCLLSAQEGVREDGPMADHHYRYGFRFPHPQKHQEQPLSVLDCVRVVSDAKSATG